MTMQDHLIYVRRVFEILHQNQLFVKESKCQFGVKEVRYLGHIVSSEGVVVDLKKIQAILVWPNPRNLKALRGFLGLAGYYRRFI